MHSFAADLDVIIHLLGFIVFILLLIVGCVFVIIFAFDIISLTRLHKYLRKYYARRLQLHQDYEVEHMNESDLFIKLQQFQDNYNEAETSTEKVVWLEGADVFRTEIGRRIALKEKKASHYKSFLPLLFIPYVDGLAQFIGYCILIPFALALLIVGVFYAILAIKEMRTNRLLKAERARVVQLHKELQLDQVATSDLITSLLHLQETAKNTPSSDPSFLGLRDRIEATQNELARRPWGTR